MPVGFNSPARNLFLLGSSGAQVVTNFFKTIDQSAGTDGVYLPDEIKYNSVDQKFVLAGSAEDSNSKGFGWFEKRDDAGTADWDVRIEATQTGVNTTLRAMELDSNDNLIVVGKTADIPWIAKYSNGGVIDWQSTTNSGDVEYTGITSDANGNYYACGNTPVAGEAQAFVEKFDASGNPGWGKSAFMLGRDVVLNKVAANTRGEVVAVGYLEDNIYNKGYIVKIDTNTGEVLWDRTLTPDWQGDMLNCTDVYIDSNDQIYVTVNGNFVGYLLKYTAEGNMIWQKVSNDSAASTITFDQVKSDGETEQTIVFGTYTDPNTNDVGGILSKYSKSGNLVWRRTLFSSYNNYDTFANVSLDADPSFYYLLYTDGPVDGLNGTPDAYTFGKVSSSGNGLGDFQYAEGTGETIDYEILSVGDTIGRLSDGSVRNDTSDNLVYPFNGTKILFDDLATQVSNKKRQMDSADSFEYSGSPAIRPADFQELNLLGDVYSGSGNWLDQSGKGNDGVASLTEPFFGAGSVSFDGSGDYIYVSGTNNQFAFDTGDFTVEFFINTSNWDIVPYDSRPVSLNGDYFTLYITSSGALTWYQGGAVRIQGSNGEIAQNTWVHLAATRQSGQSKLFVNGNQTGSTFSDSTNYIIPADRPFIGEQGRTLGASGLNGYISNLHIVKGTALYTSNFTPPTTSLTAITGTELLTCQGDTIADASANNFTITANGNAAPTDDGPTHNADGYWEFDGVDDSISIPSDSINAMTTGDYSVEFWVYINSIQPDTGNGDNDLVEKWTDVDGYPFVFRYVRASGTINAVVYGPPTSASATLNISTDTWNHVCGVFNRTTNQLSLYVNYTSSITTSIAAVTGDTTNDSDLFLMKRGSGINHAAGRFGELRIYPRALTAAQVFQNYNATKSKYINEAPDTAPKIGPGIVYDSNLVLNYDFGNRATYDRTENLSAYSQDFTNTSNQGWSITISRATRISDTGIDDPEGGTSASRWQSGNNNSQELIYHLLPTALTVGETYTVSCWIRRVDGVGPVRFYLGDNVSLDVTTQLDAVPFGTWVRCSATRIITGANGTPLRNYISVFPNVDGGDKTTIDIWGMNVNQGSTPGRYIKTYGSAITAPTTVKNLTPIGNTFFYNATLGVIGNAPTFNPAGYFEFDAANDEVIALDGTATDPFPKPTGPTVEAWAWKSNWNDGAEGRIVSCTQGGGYQIGLGETLMGSANVGSIMYVNGAYAVTQYARSNLSSGWHHFVGTFNGTTLRFYVDGTEVDTDSSRSGNVTYPTTTDFLIGGEPGGAGFPDTAKDLTGRVAEVRVYDRVLTSTEISQNFNATRSKYGV